jgi:hypothetical protein
LQKNLHFSGIAALANVRFALPVQPVDATPTTPAGAAALIQYIPDDDLEADESYPPPPLAEA